MSRTVVTFDGADLTELCHVGDLRTSVLPRGIRSIEVPGRDGTLFTGTNLGTRIVTLTLTVRATDIVDRQDALRSLASILAVDEPKQLALSIDGGIYYMAMPTSTPDAERYLTATSFEVAFECTDPVAYGDEVTVTVPSGGSLDLTVGGTYPTMPTISATAAVNDGTAGRWIVRLDGTSMRVVADCESAAGVVCDCAERVLTVDDVVTLLDPASDWMVLAPGDHTLTMTGTGAATVTYQERWL